MTSTKRGDPPLFFRQLLAGRDFARGDAAATQMVNFVYLIGDADRKQCVVVDPAWDVAGLLELVAREGLELTGVLATHYHPDHVGGDLFGARVEGIVEVLGQAQVPIHCQRDEVPWIRSVTGVTDDDLVAHGPADVVKVGAIPIELIHTPGHTPGSQCFLVGDRLVAGDTLFLKGCGRTDLPGGDPEQLYLSLTQRLARVPDSAILYPGHLYDPRPSASLGETRRSNYVLRISSLEDWLRLV